MTFGTQSETVNETVLENSVTFVADPLKHVLKVLHYNAIGEAKVTVGRGKLMLKRAGSVRPKVRVGLARDAFRGFHFLISCSKNIEKRYFSRNQYKRTLSRRQ